MKGYLPMKGDLVWLYSDIKKSDEFFSFYQMTYIVIDIVYLKGKKILIKVKERGGFYRGWFNVEKVSNFYRDDFFNPILVNKPVKKSPMRFNIHDPILIDFLKADKEFSKIMKEIKYHE